jgi:hypothetical protein
MAFIAMSTNNPLGKRPFSQMGGLAGDYDFPNAPLPWRTPPEMATRSLAGNAGKQILRPPFSVVEQSSPWTAESPVMMLGADVATSTQTAVATTDTTPSTTTAVPASATVAQSWFAQQTLIPGIDNWAVGLGLLAIAGIFAAKH